MSQEPITKTSIDAMVFDVVGTLVDETGSVRADGATDQGEWACASLLVPPDPPFRPKSSNS
jgi:hypothetical protein